MVAEASLTGESEAVLKEVAPLSRPAVLGDRVNMVFSGTAVTRGRGTAVVTATGMATEMGTVARLLGRTVKEQTPLQREVARIGRTLGLAVIVIAAIVVGAILLTADISGASDLVDVLLVGVSLAVAAVPEGLPAILSVVLALGVQRMARRRAIVKKLSSVETLGSASVVCSDKTGTLTKNEMTIQKIVTASGEVDVTGSGYRPEGELRAGGRLLGDGPLRDLLPEAVGFVPPAGLGPYYDRASVVVVPSRREGYGMTAREAMAHGRPVVASAVGGLVDAIEDGVSGVLLDDPRDLRGYGEAVRALVEDPARARTLGDAAHLRVRDRFLGTRSLLDYLGLIERLI